MTDAACTTTVSPTSQSEKPYMPTWYETWRSANQFVRWSSCRPPRSKLKRTSDSIQTPTSARAVRTAIAPAVNASHGNSQTSRAPPSGIRINAVVSQPIDSPHRDEDDRDHGEAGGDRERVGTDQAGLQLPRPEPQVAERLGDAADGAEDERLLDSAPEEPSEGDRRPVEREVVELVEVELVLERALRVRVLRDGPRPGAVDQPGDADSC